MSVDYQPRWQEFRLLANDYRCRREASSADWSIPINRDLPQVKSPLHLWHKVTLLQQQCLLGCHRLHTSRQLPSLVLIPQIFPQASDLSLACHSHLLVKVYSILIEFFLLVFWIHSCYPLGWKLCLWKRTSSKKKYNFSKQGCGKCQIEKF